MCQATGRQFGNCRVSFTGAWSETAASCAYDVWKNLPLQPSVWEEHLPSRKHSALLVHLSKQSYLKRAKGGMVRATFGLSRATYVLHVFSGAEFPIYDRNTHRGAYLLTGGRYADRTILKTKEDDPAWYLDTFCSIVRQLGKTCAASPRRVDQALFCFGKSS